MIIVNFFHDFTKAPILLYNLYTLDYSHATDLNINEPDSRWAKSIKEDVLRSVLAITTYCVLQDLSHVENNSDKETYNVLHKFCKRTYSHIAMYLLCRTVTLCCSVFVDDQV